MYTHIGIKLAWAFQKLNPKPISPFKILMDAKTTLDSSTRFCEWEYTNIASMVLQHAIGYLHGKLDPEYHCSLTPLLICKE